MYLYAAPVAIRRRLLALSVALLVVLVSSAWWVLAVQLTPVDMRPYIGGSTDGTAVQLLFGYDGLGRIFGELTGGAALRSTEGLTYSPATGVPGAFGGDPGLLRMFNRDFGGQVGWLLPFAAIGAIASLALRFRAPRTDLARAAVLMWTLWLAVHFVVFSLMGGIIHSYYVVVMAPAIGALVGTGTVDLWRARSAHPRLAGLSLAAAIAVTAAVAWDLLSRTPDFLPGLATVVLVGGHRGRVGHRVARAHALIDHGLHGAQRGPPGPRRRGRGPRRGPRRPERVHARCHVGICSAAAIQPPVPAPRTACSAACPALPQRSAARVRRPIQAVRQSTAGGPSPRASMRATQAA